MRGLCGTVVSATLCTLSCFSGSLAAAAAAEPAGFSGGSFTPTSGRVGYHMVSAFEFQARPCRPDEHIHVTDVTVKGTVPPGLTSPGLAGQGGNGTPNFEGTPRQAGDWQVYATLHDLSCSAVYGAAGPIDYGDVGIPINFHIDP